MDKEYEVRRHTCAICGKTTKTVMLKAAPESDYPLNKFYKMRSTGDLICKACESEYHVLDNYSYRGYGYKFSTEPRFTTMDKRSSTPTFGFEIEVAGNIKNIEKIRLLTEKTQECSIGYDTSVEGAMFEFSYAPGTFYWYLHESHLSNVCKLLQKDPWVIDSTTIGNHIHIGNIDVGNFYKDLITSANVDDMFWKVMRVIAEREFNRYCATEFRLDHHDAISYNTRWRTVEFRMFAGTYSAEKILARMRFIRQIYNNISEEEGIKWHTFSPESINWFKTLLAKNRKFSKEEKEKILQIFETETEKTEASYQHDPSGDIRNRFRNAGTARPFWFDVGLHEEDEEYEPDYDEEENY
jgi:hypothetical protein